MTYSEKNVKLIKALSDAIGPSGFEDEVLDVVREALADICTFEEDKVRNLYIYRKNHTGEKPVLMLDAHGDEVGFMIHSIKPNGTLRFVGLGRMDGRGLSSAELLVRNTEGEYIPGIVGLRPPHFSNGNTANSLDLQNFSIDVGATSAEEAVNEFQIGIGEPVVPSTVCRFDEKHGLFFGKAFDCRIGVAALIETLRQLDGLDLPFDVVGVISSQEEIGDRGIKVAVNKVKPDIAICFEGCPADDTFTEPYAIQTALGKGPMFRHMDVSVICAPRFQRWTLDLAQKKGIPVQESVRQGGGNNAAAVQTTLGGAPAVVAGVPVRYVHSTNCISTEFDFEATVQMVIAMLENIDADVIRGM